MRFRDRHSAASTSSDVSVPEPSPASPEGLLEARLRDAVVAGRFHLHYQPVVSVLDGRPQALEALLRWESDAGRVAPGTFIPVLEATGLIREVGPWILAQACRQARNWLDGVPDLLLAVNVSPNQIEPGFAESVLDILTDTGLPAAQLCLELVRPAAIADPASAWNELRRVKSYGVRLFVDDFGALGTSIADLRRFAVDAVKIDSSLVAGLGRDPGDEAIVTALVSLAHALGMQCIAEGVETEAQLQRLRTLGCDLAQGFHLSEPLAPAAVGRLLAATAPVPSLV
jgi:EAL domain-containing protein (putative c-di-GMP-specific phosphodiesterase class I)